MNNGFVQIGSSHAGIGGENSFWPSFTDVMMVITLIFLMATSILVVRNWQLVAELQESVAAEQIASQMIESTGCWRFFSSVNRPSSARPSYRVVNGRGLL